MKTYAEEQGKETFDWNEFLNRTNLSEYDWELAERKAGMWVTCACGNLCSLIPRLTDGEPTDRKLSKLGMKFYESCEEKDQESAKTTIQAIEKRSAELIKELQCNKA